MLRRTIVHNPPDTSGAPRSSSAKCIPPFITILLALCLPYAGVVHAGGLWINEYGSPSMGRAGAGAESAGSDASAALLNPASMTRVEGDQLMISGGFIKSKIEFDVARSSPINGDGDGGDAGDIAPTASAFYVRHLSDNWAFGVSMAGLTGAALEYDRGWAGRYQDEEVELVGLALMPSVAYRLNDHVSFGIGIPVMYSDLTMKVAVPTPPGTPDGRAKIDGDDFKASFSLSTLIEFSETSRLGFTYVHEFDMKYSGGAEVQPAGLDVGVETELLLATKVRAGFTQVMSDDLTVHLSVGWENWSALEEVNLSTQTGGAELPRNWDDTYYVGWGFDYRFNPKWQMHGGFAYDTNPVDKEDRTADMPIDRQVRYALGVGYQKSDNLSIGAELVYADYGKARIDALGYDGRYSSNDLIFFSVNASWKLGK